MSAFIDLQGAGPGATHGGAGGFVRGAVTGMLRHAADLGALVDTDSRRWSEALLSETRAHLAGCLNSVQTGLALELDSGWLARAVEALGPAYSRDALERQAALLSPALLAHFRHRATAALMLRTRLSQISGTEDAAEGVDPGEAVDERLGEALAALRLSVDPWHDPHPLDRPMRTDLPAEIFDELVWTVAALLLDGLATRLGVETATAAAPVARAATRIIARHDEQTGPFARAAYAALLLEDGAADRHAVRAATGRDLLLLAAIGARRTGMAMALALDLLIDGNSAERAAFARVLHLPDTAYAALLTGLSPARDEVPDVLLPGLIDTYRALTMDVAATILAPWLGPEPLVAKLARIDRQAR